MSKQPNIQIDSAGRSYVCLSQAYPAPTRPAPRPLRTREPGWLLKELIRDWNIDLAIAGIATRSHFRNAEIKRNADYAREMINLSLRAADRMRAHG